MRTCAHTVVDIRSAQSYHIPMPCLADADLAVRPDPERQLGRRRFRARTGNLLVTAAPDSLTHRLQSS